MASYISDQHLNVVGGVGTWTYTVPATGDYDISATATVLPPSDLVIKIKLGGVDQVTSATPSAAAGIVSAAIRALKCTAADSITVVATSSAGIGLNDVKIIILASPSVIP